MGFLSPTKDSNKNWLIFSILSVLSILIWYQFTYPHFSFLDLSINRSKALAIAEDYLSKEKGITLSDFRTAIVFETDTWADRYMQKAMDFDDITNYLKEHDLEIFYWKARFFQENKKEQYYVTISPSTGEVIHYRHILDNSAPRMDIDKDAAQKAAINSLSERFQFQVNDYDLHSDKSVKFDERKDHTFYWEKRGAAVPWNDDKDSGSAKLLSTAIISGNETLEFTKKRMDVPDQFKRFIWGQKSVGSNFSVVFRMFYFFVLAVSIFHVTTKRNSLILHNSKNFAMTITGILFILYFVTILNTYERTIFQYQTTSTFLSYLWRFFMNFLLDSFIVTIGILMPCLAGESIRYEVNPGRPKSSFLHYLQSTWLSRDVFQLIALGYLVGIIMMGIQSMAFAFGERYLGVWVEYYWLSQLSTGYIPFLSAFILAFNASVSEEIAFRLFCINFGQKVFKKIFPAILISSIIWGFGHSTYNIFPMWFRGLEVTLLGIFLSIVYLKYGIIPTIVGHYLFDAFWTSSPYLLGKSTLFDFTSSLAILILPLGLGLIAYISNRREVERPLKWNMSRHQIFNLGVLKSFLKHEPSVKSQSRDTLRRDISSHGWDVIVVETALDETGKDS